MSATLTIQRAGPAISVQDLGRPGHMAQGISTGGAADRQALFEAAALLLLPAVAPAIEMASLGGVFTTDAPMRFALTGAPMKATIDGYPLAWSASHTLHPVQRLEIGGASVGVYGYLTPAATIDAPAWLGSRAVHGVAGVGKPLAAGDALPLGEDPRPEAPSLTLDPGDRFSGGEVRLMPGPQTALFPKAVLDRALATEFRRGAQANRQGVRLDHGGEPFGTEAAAGLASDFIIAGDVQMTGDGVPYVLMSECQTIGGYPRLGTVLPDDLPRVAQAPLGARLRLALVTTEAADALWKSDAERLRLARGGVRPLFRDPASMRDLLSYQLISGATSGDYVEGSD